MVNELGRIQLTVEEAKAVLDANNIPCDIDGDGDIVSKPDGAIGFYYTATDLKIMSNTAKSQEDAESDFYLMVATC